MHLKKEVNYALSKLNAPKERSKLWLHSSLISHGFLLQRHGNCLTQFHKLLVLTCCTQLL